MVSVGQDGGAVFTAVLPGCLPADAPAEPGSADHPAAPAHPAVPEPRVVS